MSACQLITNDCPTNHDREDLRFDFTPLVSAGSAHNSVWGVSERGAACLDDQVVDVAPDALAIMAGLRKVAEEGVQTPLVAHTVVGRVVGHVVLAGLVDAARLLSTIREPEVCQVREPVGALGAVLSAGNACKAIMADVDTQRVETAHVRIHAQVHLHSVRPRTDNLPALEEERLSNVPLHHHTRFGNLRNKTAQHDHLGHAARQPNATAAGPRILNNSTSTH